MSADASAYTALGLEPGADAADIERAYKALIKQFHPDRAGGDALRAAEINRAYRELRLAGQVKEALDLQRWDDLRAPRDGAVRAAVVVLALAGAITLVAAPMLSGALTGDRRPPLVLARKAEPDRPRSSVEPIAASEVDRAVADAVRTWRSGDEMALAAASRDCHMRLRQQPGWALLDRCTAFDSAAVQLLDRDPLRDRGPFGELAVTGRQRSSAQGLSDDYLAVDSRLSQVRLRVELELSPRQAEADPEPAAN
jgi:hypothetical protein